MSVTSLPAPPCLPVLYVELQSHMCNKCSSHCVLHACPLGNVLHPPFSRFLLIFQKSLLNILVKWNVLFQVLRDPASSRHLPPTQNKRSRAVLAVSISLAGNRSLLVFQPAGAASCSGFTRNRPEGTLTRTRAPALMRPVV